MGVASGRESVADAARSILVVEDDEFVREAFVAVLRGNGQAVEEATDGAEAIAKLRAGKTALIVLDLGLPGISGLRVLEWMSQNSPQVPVLVVTGLENPPNVLVRFPNLVKIMQKKPVPNDLLLHLVETYTAE
jgi:CheY-like chemotaxis protein